jgi:DNA topoisomerase-6 subunit B
MLDFMQTHFHRVSERIATKFLEFAGISKSKNPRKLGPEEVVKLVQTMKRFEEFRPPSASCLSPLSEDLLRAGILKELKPDFVAVCQRKPATYAGHPFVVEAAVAYGGEVPKKSDFVLYRFANRIPLLYDEASDVAYGVVKAMNWRRYRVSSDMPIAVLVHICSTKIPYKTVGKEFIADRPEVKKEVLNGIREAARRLRRFLSKREHVEKERRRLSVFSKYLPKIARFSTQLAGRETEPDIEKMLESVSSVGKEKRA